MKLYTIGFTQKSAAIFFELLRQNGIQRLVDIRISPQGQLSGFARQEDLPYFLDELVNHCVYIHLPLLAPTKDLLHEYRGDRDWLRYTARFEALMDERRIPESLTGVNLRPSVPVCYAAKPLLKSAIAGWWLKDWRRTGLVWK